MIRKLEGEDSVLALSGMGPARGSRVAALMTKHWLEMALVYLGARNLADVLATLDAAGLCPTFQSSAQPNWLWPDGRPVEFPAHCLGLGICWPHVSAHRSFGESCICMYCPGCR